MNGSSTRVSKRTLSFLLALVMAFALAACALTACGGGKGKDVTVALTVVDTTDGTVVYNDKVAGVTDKSTVADMLAAAGFKAGDQDASAADAHTYFVSNDAPYFLGKGFDETSGNWWVTLYDGDSNQWASAMLKADGKDVLVKDGGHYQYIYSSDMAFEYTDAIPDPLA